MAPDDEFGDIARSALLQQALAVIGNRMHTDLQLQPNVFALFTEGQELKYLMFSS